MSTRFGNDIVLNEDGDIITNSGGDFLDTDAVQTLNDDEFNFEGEYNMKASIGRRLVTIKGSFPFDPTFGSNLPLQVSSTNLNIVAAIKEIVKSDLKEDSRVKEILAVKVEKHGEYVDIAVKLRLIGSNEVSTFVFPNIYVG